MSYTKGQPIDPDVHVLTDKGELKAIAKDFGPMVALACLDSTYPTVGMLAKCLVGLTVGVAAALAVTKAAGLL